MSKKRADLLAELSKGSEGQGRKGGDSSIHNLDLRDKH